MEIKDLVVLAYSQQNECYTSVLSIKEAEEIYKKYEFSVNLDKNTWSFDKKNYFIASSRTCEQGSRWGIIGVYSRGNDRHLDRMVSAGRNATSSPSYHDD